MGQKDIGAEMNKQYAALIIKESMLGPKRHQKEIVANPEGNRAERRKAAKAKKKG